MNLVRRSRPRLIALFALSLAGCSKREPSPIAEPLASAAPVSASAQPTSSAASLASAAPPPRFTVTKVKLVAGKSDVEYVKLQHPNGPAVGLLDDLLKKEAEKEAAALPGRARADMEEHTECDGGFPTGDIVWVSCAIRANYVNRSAPYVRIENRVWSLAGKEPARLALKSLLTGDWIGAIADAVCMPQFESFSFVRDDPHMSIVGQLREGQSFRPQKEGLVLTFTQGVLGGLGDGVPECTIPWDKLGPFVPAGSPLRGLVDAAPPSPPPVPLEQRPARSAIEDPQRRPQNLPAPFDAQQSACDKGDQRACVKVGEAIYAGKELTEDVELAAWIFQKACDAGEPTGCVNLGWGYLNSTMPDPGAAAAPIFARACTDKVVIGCLGLGTIYLDGRGTAKDSARAAALFDKACQGGVKAACAMAKAALAKKK
jgi:hypothetical protein